MELRHIKELMGAMERSGVTKVVVKRDGEYEVTVERQSGQLVQVPHAEVPYLNPLPARVAPEPLVAGTPHPPLVAEEPPGKFVTSPMVGTFYTSPSPDDPSFIKLGDQIDANTVVCIVEAMKVMNEVKAGVSGTVAEVLLTNGSPVEFGTKLLRVV